MMRGLLAAQTFGEMGYVPPRPVGFWGDGDGDGRKPGAIETCVGRLDDRINQFKFSIPLN